MIRQIIGKDVAKLALILVMAASVMACGDDEAEVNNQTENNNDVNNQDPGDDECAEGETVNPITGDCVEAVNNQPGEPNNQPDGTNNNQPVEPNNQPDEFECGPGGLIGQTCRPDGGAIPGATVTIEGFDCDGAPVDLETTADGEGYYSFDDVPAGNHTISITSGSFEAEEEVTVLKDQITDRESIGEKVCLTGEEVDIAIVEGTFDDIGEILDGMEIEYDTYPNTSALMGDLDDMNAYEIIFVECINSISSGTGFTEDDMEFNVRRFVEEGGSLYASDRASDVIERSVPDAMEFGGLASVQTVQADVTSDTMHSILDTDTAEIYFDTSVDMVVEATNPGNEIHFMGDVDISGGGTEYRPLMTSYEDPLSDGYLIFTSFHNIDDATDDMDQILQYMIFQL